MFTPQNTVFPAQIERGEVAIREVVIGLPCELKILSFSSAGSVEEGAKENVIRSLGTAKTARELDMMLSAVRGYAHMRGGEDEGRDFIFIFDCA